MSLSFLRNTREVLDRLSVPDTVWIRTTTWIVLVVIVLLLIDILFLDVTVKLLLEISFSYRILGRLSSVLSSRCLMTLEVFGRGILTLVTNGTSLFWSTLSTVDWCIHMRAAGSVVCTVVAGVGRFATSLIRCLVRVSSTLRFEMTSFLSVRYVLVSVAGYGEHIMLRS